MAVAWYVLMYWVRSTYGCDARSHYINEDFGER